MSETSPQFIQIEDADHYTIIRLNRPDKRNALSAGLIAELDAALAARAANAWPLILTGNGAAFCAGADLDALRRFSDRTPAENESDAGQLRGLFSRILTHPAPVIAAVNGPALAGGCGLTTACDHVIAVPGATFGYPEVKIGFVAAIVAPLLVRGIGERRARNLLLTGRTLTAAEAKEIGLVHEIVQPEQLLDHARLTAAMYLRRSPTALAMTKRGLNDTTGLSLEAALDYGVKLNAEARASADLREGVGAFLEKREAHWPSRKA